MFVQGFSIETEFAQGMSEVSNTINGISSYLHQFPSQFQALILREVEDNMKTKVEEIFDEIEDDRIDARFKQLTERYEGIIPDQKMAELKMRIEVLEETVRRLEINKDAVAQTLENNEEYSTLGLSIGSVGAVLSIVCMVLRQRRGPIQVPSA